MRNTFKVLFFVNGSKEKNGVAPILGRVTVNGQVAQFSWEQKLYGADNEKIPDAQECGSGID